MSYRIPILIHATPNFTFLHHSLSVRNAKTLCKMILLPIFLCCAVNPLNLLFSPLAPSSQPKWILCSLLLPTNRLPARFLLGEVFITDSRLLLRLLFNVEERLAAGLAHLASQVADGFQACLQGLA
jgi:hypothetical protein